MSNYTSITIIYNPNSTGSGKELAEKLRNEIATTLPEQAVDLVETEYAGHGEKLAYDLARASRRPLVISSSGDGGYHEVVNGLMKAQSEGAQPVAGLLPAGNANDHFRNLHDTDTATIIAGGKEQRIDLLRMSATVGGKPKTRYAHSYIGIGLTPKVGQELNKTQLNFIKEAWFVLKVLFILQPVHVVVDGRKATFDSLIFSNVAKMSKVLSLAPETTVDDGKFEVTAFYRHNKLKLISSLLRASTRGLTGDKQVKKYQFSTIKATLVQLDGEIATIDSATEVTIDIEPQTLRCIV